MKNIDLGQIKGSEAEFTVIDFETTGTSAKHNRVIEIGLVKLKNGKILNSYSSLINPGVRVPPYITELTGISNDEVMSAPYFDEIYSDVVNFIGSSVLVAHNLQFDYSFLKSETARNNLEMIDNASLCTLRLARKLFPALRSKSLGALVKHFRIRHKGVHRALGDATATAKLLLKLIEAAKVDHHIDNLQELIDLQSKKLTTKKVKFIKKKLIDDFNKLPAAPGVYLFKDAQDEVVYIGKAKSLKTRVKNYFTDRSDSKTRKIVRASSKISFYETNSEVTALLAEAELIKRLDPPVNTLLKRYSINYFIRIKKNVFFPVPEIVRDFDFDGNDYFGPYSERENAKIIIELVNKSFKLRECKDKEFKKKRICYLAEIDRCVAPCVDESVTELYKQELDHLYGFLAGQNQTSLNRLIEKMKYYSDLQKFEVAAEYRDVTNLLLNQIHRSSVIREPINSAHVLLEINSSPQKDYIFLCGGKVLIKDFFLDERKEFDKYLKDYYDGSIHIFNELELKELERLKIVLSWLLRNKEKVKIHYLEDFNSLDELYLKMTI